MGLTNSPFTPKGPALKRPSFNGCEPSAIFRFMSMKLCLETPGALFFQTRTSPLSFAVPALPPQFQPSRRFAWPSVEAVFAPSPLRPMVHLTFCSALPTSAQQNSTPTPPRPSTTALPSSTAYQAPGPRSSHCTGRTHATTPGLVEPYRRWHPAQQNEPRGSPLAVRRCLGRRLVNRHARNPRQSTTRRIPFRRHQHRPCCRSRSICYPLPPISYCPRPNHGHVPSRPRSSP
mmetsp:Transcript_8527/g.16440  ORF Transcript_8527/g.16440 Transcript_8527/m.16440 type:complete len:232 (-) Transcript_8527:1091-1786(-)